jgi:hypothetical protein
MLKKKDALPGTVITFNSMVSGWDKPGNFFTGSGITLDSSDSAIIIKSPKKVKDIAGLVIPLQYRNKIYWFYWQDIYRYGKLE